MQNSILKTHPDWHDILGYSMSLLDKKYIQQLQTGEWLPGMDNLFAAFQYPLSETHYILLGESPYPRAESANGFAFWDNAVDALWSDKGLSKTVNRATSLRNILKMLLLARGDLSASNVSQEAIAVLNKSNYVQTGTDLFLGFIKKGFLLLNATLVYREGEVNEHARYWQPFMHGLFEQLAREKPSLQLVLLGRIAEKIPKTGLPIALQALHPYNLSFITNPDVIQFFKPMDLLTYHASSKNNH